MLKPIEIQAKTFKTGRGYKKEEVDEFILQVGKDYEELYKETTELKDKINSLNEGLQYYKSMESTLQKALVLAEKTSSETTENAEKKAEEIEAEAKQKADQMLEDAKMEIGKIVLQKNALMEEYQTFRMRFKKLALTQLEAMEGPQYRERLEKEMENGQLSSFVKREFPELKQPEPISLFLDEAKKQSAAKLDEAVEKTVDELIRTELEHTPLPMNAAGEAEQPIPVSESDAGWKMEETKISESKTTATETVEAKEAKEVREAIEKKANEEVKETVEEKALEEVKATVEEKAVEEVIKAAEEKTVEEVKETAEEIRQTTEKNAMKEEAVKDSEPLQKVTEAAPKEQEAPHPEKETLQDIFAKIKARPEDHEGKKETQIPWNDIIHSSKEEPKPEMIDISKRIDVSNSEQNNYRILDSYQKGSMKVVYAVKEKPGQVIPEGDTHKVITEEEKRKLEDTVRFEIIE